MKCLGADTVSLGLGFELCNGERKTQKKVRIFDFRTYF